MEAKKDGKKNFFKKNLYYFVVGFVLIVAITLTVVLMVTGNKSNIITGDNSQNGQLDNNGGGNGNNSSIEKPVEPDKDNEENKGEDNKPVEVIVSFISPLDNATILCDYTETSLVYNQTLNIYTGHMAIDFGAPMGTDVKAVYDGVVESVETSYLKGTTVVIDHGNNLKTVYNSIDVDENMVKGKKLNKGDVIGKVSDNNKQEYKDGPHLHFEVMENGKKISPYKYLTIKEK